MHALYIIYIRIVIHVVMVYEDTDDPCTPLMETHSLSWLLHKKVALLAGADLGNSIPTMLAVYMPKTCIF